VSLAYLFWLVMGSAESPATNPMSASKTSHRSLVPGTADRRESGCRDEASSYDCSSI
jgi:hypothetical protein